MRGKIAMAALGLLLAASVASGQTTYTSPETGIKPLGSYASWGDIDSVSLTNGNLLLNIPLFSLPGRELPVSMGVSFNSQFMERRTMVGPMGQTVTVWESQAWHKNTGIGGTLSGTSRSTTDGLFIEIYWIGPDGSKTRFSDTVTVPSGTAAHTYLDNRTLDAADSSFLRLETGHYFNGRLNPSETRKPAILYFPNGTTLTFERDTDSATEQPLRWKLATANGNTVSAVDATGTMAGTEVNLYDLLLRHGDAGERILHHQHRRGRLNRPDHLSDIRQARPGRVAHGDRSGPGFSRPRLQHIPRNCLRPRIRTWESMRNGFTPTELCNTPPSW